MDIFVAKGDFRNTDVVSAIEATGHRVTLDAAPYYCIEAVRGYVNNYELMLGMTPRGISFALLTVERNKCRHVVFADVNLGRTASFSAETGYMSGKKDFVPKFWQNWMNDK